MTTKREKMPYGVRDAHVVCHVCGSGCRTTDRGTYAKHYDGLHRDGRPRKLPPCPQGVGRGQPVPRNTLIAALREDAANQEASAANRRTAAERARDEAARNEAEADGHAKRAKVRRTALEALEGIAPETSR